MAIVIHHISYDQLQDWQAQGKAFQLIDVREPEEHKAFNIGGTLLPLGDLLQHVDQLDTSKPIIFYCKRGIRSQIAIQRLASKLPYAQLYNLQNGILHVRT